MGGFYSNLPVRMSRRVELLDGRPISGYKGSASFPPFDVSRHHDVADIQRIRQELWSSCPRISATAFSINPFSDDSFASTCMGHSRRGRPHRGQPGPRPPLQDSSPQRPLGAQKNHFMIGNDGGEEQYYSTWTIQLARSQVRSGNGELITLRRRHGPSRGQDSAGGCGNRRGDRTHSSARKAATWWQFWRKLSRDSRLISSHPLGVSSSRPTLIAPSADKIGPNFVRFPAPQKPSYL